MNIYFLLEGKRTEMKVYPRWLKFLVPFLERVDSPYQVTDKNYYLFSAEGYPSVINDDLENAIAEINEIGRFDYLVICLDSDGEGIKARENEIYNKIREKNLRINPRCRVVSIIQNICFETWFLGNERVLTRNPTENFKDFIDFYDVANGDPEEMGKPLNYNGSISDYHFDYLRFMLSEKHCTYSKNRPHYVCREHYLEELKKRVKETSHLNSLKCFFDFCDNLTLVNQNT